MLSGRYPVRRVRRAAPAHHVGSPAGHASPAATGAKRVAIANAGTIPDRGLYGVFLAGADRPVARRRARRGDGLRDPGRRDVHARRLDLARRGDHARPRARVARARRAGQDAVLARRSGGPSGGARVRHRQARSRAARASPPAGRSTGSVRITTSIATAAENLLRYLDDQAAAGARPGRPHDRHRALPRRARRLARLPAVAARQPHPRAVGHGGRPRRSAAARASTSKSCGATKASSSAFPDVEEPPDPCCCCRTRTRSKASCCGSSGRRSLFAARFRETAARALLLPRRRPGMRDAVVAAAEARRRSAGRRLALRIVSRAARDLPRGARAITSTCRRSWTLLRARRSAHAARRPRSISKAPSPFAASLLFSYVANYIYDGDAPLAETACAGAVGRSGPAPRAARRRGAARAARIPTRSTDRAAAAAPRRQLPCAARADGLHDLLIQHRRPDRRGDRGPQRRWPIRAARSPTSSARGASCHCRSPASGASSPSKTWRGIATRWASRCRPDFPRRCSSRCAIRPATWRCRFARSHGRSPPAMFAARYGLGRRRGRIAAARGSRTGRLIEGEFRPGGTDREWVDADVLRAASQPIARAPATARSSRWIPTRSTVPASWHGIGSARRGAEALLDAIEQLQGRADCRPRCSKREILPARVADYQPAMLDTLMAAGEVVWVGVEPLGERDGRIALYLTDHRARLLAAIQAPAHRKASYGESSRPRGEDRRAGLSPTRSRRGDPASSCASNGASFFAAIHQGTGEGFPPETVDALWDLVWKASITNDTLHRCCARSHGLLRRARHAAATAAARPSGRAGWCRPPPKDAGPSIGPRRTPRHNRRPNGARRSPSSSSRATASSRARRPRAEGIAGGFSAVYQVLKAMEDAGRVRRELASSPASEARSSRCPPRSISCDRCARDAMEPRVVILAATDPANPYGSTVKWPGACRRRTHPSCRRGRGARGRLPAPRICGGAIWSCCCWPGDRAATIAADAQRGGDRPVLSWRRRCEERDDAACCSRRSTACRPRPMWRRRSSVRRASPPRPWDCGRRLQPGRLRAEGTF